MGRALGEGRGESSTYRGDGGAWSSETTCPSPQRGGLHRAWGGGEGGDGLSRSLSPCSRALACPPATPGSLPGRLHSAPPSLQTEFPAPPARRSRVPRASLGRPALCGLSWERQKPPRPHLRSVHCADVGRDSVTWTSRLPTLGVFSKRWPRVIVSACPASQGHHGVTGVAPWALASVYGTPPGTGLCAGPRG